MVSRKGTFRVSFETLNFGACLTTFYKKRVTLKDATNQYPRKLDNIVSYPKFTLVLKLKIDCVQSLDLSFVHLLKIHLHPSQQIGTDFSRS